MVARTAQCHLLLVALIILTSCTGAAAPAELQGNGSAPDAAALLLSGGLPALPEGREASTAVDWYVDGKDTFDRSLTASDGDTSLYLPSGIGELAWGIWQFNPWLESIESIQVEMSIPGGDEAYVALADYSKGAWEFDGPLTTGKSLALDNEKHRSASGNMYLAVITHGGNTATVSKLVLTTEDGWVIASVEDYGGWETGGNTSLAVIDGKPAISYFLGDPDYDLKYARSSTVTGSNAADWSVITVDSPGSVGKYSSLAEVAGQPAISYQDDTNDALKYARLFVVQPEAWTVIAVHTSDIGQEVGSHTSLAVVNGYPMITYHDAGEGYLRYAWSNTATGINEADWQTSVIDSQETVVGEFNSLAAVDGKGAVSYFKDYTVNSLMYKWFSNPAKVAVETPIGKAQYTSLAVVNGKPGISWHDTGVPSLNFSYSSTVRGTSNADWTTVVVDYTEGAGRYTSLAVIDGRPAIAYQRYAEFPQNTRLMFAWSSAAGGENTWDWNTITLDVCAWGTGNGASLVEVDGKPAISYYAGLGTELKYAIRMGQ